MEENTPKQAQPGEALSEEQVNKVAGGDGNTTTVTANACGPGVSVTGPNASSVFIETYEGVVDLTSHVIERVVGGLKS